MEKHTIQSFKERKWIIGMVHVEALPGTPKHSKPIQSIIEKSIAEAMQLQDAGVDAILIENMHDVPYLKKSVVPEIVASMTSVAVEIRKRIHIPIGIQILAGANKEAIAVAQAAGLEFIRAEGFVYAHVADEGYIESCAGELLRYRKMIGADHIMIFTDAQKKHSSHALTSDLSLKDHVETAIFFGSDGIIITGTSTGKAAIIEDVRTAKLASNLPILVGSGITSSNILDYWELADAFIVGSWFKIDGIWENNLSDERINIFMSTVNKLRSKK